MLSIGLKRLRLPLLIIVLCVMPTLVHAIVPPPSLSGWVFMPQNAPDFGYSLEEDGLVYFYSSGPVLYYNSTTRLWGEEGPVGWVYVDWPFYYEFDTSTLMYVLPPVDGLYVYHISALQWEVLPRIIPIP